MTQDQKVTVGYLAPYSGNDAFFDNVKPLVPSNITLEIEALDLVEGTLTSLVGKEQLGVERAQAIFERHPAWRGAVLVGAPVQLYAPGLPGSIRNSTSIPVTTALEASIAGLKALGAHRVMLMTPFDGPLNEMVRGFLSERGIESVLGSPPTADFRTAANVGPDDIYKLVTDGLAQAGEVDAIYFQAAILDPLPVLERMEADFKLPIVASASSMLWHILSLLGERHPVEGKGGGRLYREWPALKD
jgi:hypothetical protein